MPSYVWNLIAIIAGVTAFVGTLILLNLADLWIREKYRAWKKEEL